MRLYFTPTARAKKADPDALPLEQILALAADVNKDTPRIRSRSCWERPPRPISARSLWIRRLAQQESHRRSRGALKHELALIELKVGFDSHDKGRVLANAVLANSFNGGKHLRCCADGSYWEFNGRLWQSKSGPALCKLLMIEAAKTQPSCANTQQLVSTLRGRSTSCLAATTT
jgi:hypothetical protein